MEENDMALLSLIEPIGSDENALTQNDVGEILNRVLSLLPDQVEMFTLGDSSSVRSEIAEELLKSICFTLKMAINRKKSSFNVILSEDIHTLFKAGRAEIESEFKRGEALLNAINESSPEIRNISYNDTLKGLEVFFRKYDALFFAHEIPSDIDYQLCRAVPDSFLGVEYINEYLRLLLIENRFCGLFEPSAMESVLNSVSPDYKVHLINLYEPLAVNALGLALMGGNIRPLCITPEDRAKIRSVFKGLTWDEAVYKLKTAAIIVCRELNINAPEEVFYLEKTAVDLWPRLSAALKYGSIEGVFPSYRR